MDENRTKNCWKIFGLIWILVECNLVAGNIFGFASLFGVLPRYEIYQSKCKPGSNQTMSVKRDCSGQVAEYELAFTMGIAFYNLPAVVVGLIGDYFGPRILKLLAIICHLISWLSLAFVAPGRDWLLLFHTIFLSLTGICTLLSSFAISANFTQTRGLVTALISGAQLTGSIWYAIFEILINKQWISLSTLASIWALFSLLMLGSSFFFLDWRYTCMDSPLKPKPNNETTEVQTIGTSQDTLFRHVTNPLFILVTLFLSFLLLTISFLPVVWYRWLLYLTGNDQKSTSLYTFRYNMSAAFGIVVAPLCGLIIDYKASRGRTQKMLNISILQTLTWIGSIALCIVCMFRSLTAASTAIVILLFSRTILVAGSQALIITIFPPRFIGSLLGIMWTTAGVISFATYGLIRLVPNPANIWRGWLVILLLCVVMGGHVLQVWFLYLKSKKEEKTLQPVINEEEKKTLKSLDER